MRSQREIESIIIIVLPDIIVAAFAGVKLIFAGGTLILEKTPNYRSI